MRDWEVLYQEMRRGGFVSQSKDRCWRLALVKKGTLTKLIKILYLFIYFRFGDVLCVALQRLINVYFLGH